MKHIRVDLSRGEFFKAVEMEYYCLMLTKDLIVCNGDTILLQNIEYKGDDSLMCVLVRSVIDWDAVDFMDFSKLKYQVIVRNLNYLS